MTLVGKCTEKLYLTENRYNVYDWNISSQICTEMKIKKVATFKYIYIQLKLPDDFSCNY